MSNVPNPADRGPIPLESPLVLFAPDHWVRSEIPAPLYLLEYVPGSIESKYATKSDGFLARREDWYLERRLTEPDGTQTTAEVVGHPKLGLPSQYDWDLLLALFRLADEGRVDENGRFIDPRFREIVRAAGRASAGAPNAPALKAVKRALARWAGVRIKTWTNFDYAGDLARMRDSGSYPVVPGGRAPRLERERTYMVLVYDVERYLNGDMERDRIEDLRIDPVWLSQMGVGISAWVDVEVHNRLALPTAKAMYKQAAVRAARGFHQPMIVDIDDLRRMIGKQESSTPARLAKEIAASIEALQKEGVYSSEAKVVKTGWGRYEARLMPGPRHHAAGALRGVASGDSGMTRRLLFHCGQFGIGVKRARELIRQQPSAVLSALARAYYLKSARGGRDADGRVVDNYAGFIVRAVEGNWEFPDAEFRAWCAQMQEAALRTEHTTPVVGSASAGHEPPPTEAAASDELAVPEPAPAPQPLADDEWGRTLEQFRTQLTHQTFDTWLRPTTLLHAEPGFLVVHTPNPFAVEWIIEKFIPALCEVASQVCGEPTMISIVSRAPTPAVDP